MNRVDFEELCKDIPASDLTMMLMVASGDKADVIRRELKRRMPERKQTRPLWLEGVRVE